MKKEELIEDYLVYTDNGIERVHWCNVNGVKELVSPKGKVCGYVPDYFENKRLQEQLDEYIKTTKDQELIIKKLKRRRICTNQKERARKEHINELIAQVKELKEEIARRGRFINELKSQRKEANELLKSLTPLDRWQDDSNVNSYLKKWGVK